MGLNFLLNADRSGIILFDEKEGRLNISTHLDCHTTNHVRNLGVILDSELKLNFNKNIIYHIVRLQINHMKGKKFSYLKRAYSFWQKKRV